MTGCTTENWTLESLSTALQDMHKDNIQKYESIIIKAVHEVIPNAKVTVFHDSYVIAILSAVNFCQRFFFSWIFLLNLGLPLIVFPIFDSPYYHKCDILSI